MSHTPKPWRAVLGSSNLAVYSEGGSVCQISRSRMANSYALARTEEQSVADARLIAAAPDLLEALKQAVAFIVKEYPRHSLASGYWPDVKPIVESLDAAIAKAEGK